MKTKTILVMLATTMLLSCGGKKEADTDTAVKVKTVVVKEAGSDAGVAYPGTIEEMSGTDLSFAVAGTVKTLSISDGQKVSAGQVLGTIDATTVDNGITMAVAATQQARETLMQAEDAYNRMKMLHDKGSLSEMQWVEVQTKVGNARQLLRQAQAAEQIARKGKTDTRLTAPFAGYIVHKTGEVGQNVMPGVSIARLVRIEQVKVVLSVPEDEINKIKIGQTVRFTVASLGGESFSGTVQEKSVSADAISRCYKVKAVVDNSGHRLLPGMVCDASVSPLPTIPDLPQQAGPSLRGGVITLPANIIQIDIDNKPFVWTVNNGKAHKKYVTLGENIGNRVVITDGLTTSDKVIVEGQQKVYEGSPIGPTPALP